MFCRTKVSRLCEPLCKRTKRPVIRIRHLARQSDPLFLGVVQVSIEVPAPFRRIPVEGIEMTGRKVLQQLLRLVLPRFLLQVRVGISHLSRFSSKQSAGLGSFRDWVMFGAESSVGLGLNPY